MEGLRSEVTIELTSDMLGTVPKDKEIYKSYVASKAPSVKVSSCHGAPIEEREQKGHFTDESKRAASSYKKYYCAECSKECTRVKRGPEELIEEELETVEQVEESGWTGFHKDDEGLFIYDYMIRGFLKSALETMIENGAIKKIVAYKKWVDRLVFVFPRRIHFGLRDPSGELERPLRAMTAKGPRTGLARSDTVAAGTQIKFQILVLNNNKKLTMEVVQQVLGYGELYGLGQWRGSGGYGQFKVVKISEVSVP